MEIDNKQSVVETVSADLLKDIFSAAGLGEKTEEVTPPAKTVEEILTDKTPLPTVTAPEPEKVVELPVQTSDYSKRLKDLIKDGIIENFAINLKVDGEDQEVFLEDINDLTEEGYKGILEGWRSAQKEDINSKYVSVEGLDETTKKLIEIKRSGGDITEIIRENVTAIDQLTQLKENIDQEQIQINIVAHSLQQQGIKPTVIQAQINALIEEGVLENEANTILDSHLSVHQNAIEQKRVSEAQRVEQEKEDLKNTRKDLSAKYKEMGLPENISKVLIDNATKLDADKISNTDKLYFEAIKDPQRYAEINFLLNNPEAFKKYVTSPAVTKSKIENAKTMFTVNINKTNKPRASASTLEDVAEEIIKSNNQK